MVPIIYYFSYQKPNYISRKIIRIVSWSITGLDKVWIELEAYFRVNYPSIVHNFCDIYKYFDLRYEKKLKIGELISC